MSPKRNNGKAQSVSPVKFNAGGSKKSSQSSKKQADALADTPFSQKNEAT
eukprot:CAMPEP_0201702418 /NCGR_PEP_ID=MMETSP0578-20130828/36298_1 /ASSEMBLY_ACC=CAM_ASM_000663 /TAXON_ID=267565 /ORGANISM="Skeletonema grethea, Strain CCMP 1804" /LENGTH=49 /DNA_ID= /DNA_START= /DNA_END= /DNA_ORIENTATION=